MSFPKRLLVFCVGVGMGALLSLYILKNRGLSDRSEIPETIAEAEAEAIPGILEHYELTGMPIQSTFVIDERLEPGDESSTWRRIILLEGRLPGQLLRIEEVQKESEQGIRVEQWRVMAADRIRIRLTEGTKPSEISEELIEKGYRLQKAGELPDEYVLKIPSSDLMAVEKSIEALSSFSPQIIEVTPDYLDNPTPQQ